MADAAPNSSTVYYLWLGALSAVCGLVILKSRQDSKISTTGTAASMPAWWPCF